MSEEKRKAPDEAAAAIMLIREGKNKNLSKMIPEGYSPRIYVDLIKAQVMKPDKKGNERSDGDLLLFLYTCARTGLDPLTRQIYAVYRWDSNQGREVMAIQTGIDGMRLAAQRSGTYAGQDDAIFTPEDETAVNPTKATVTVYKQIGGARVAFTASARWSEYCPVRDGKPELMWRKMPYLMLGKCAEALALRKAFPNELSGIYTEDEMMQSKELSPLADLPKPEKLAKPTPATMPETPKVSASAKKAHLEKVQDEAVRYYNQDGRN